MRSLDGTEVYRPKGCSARLWVEPHGANLGILGVRPIVRKRRWKVLGGFLGGQGQAKPKEGVCKVFRVGNLVTLTLGRGVVAVEEFDSGETQDNSTLTFR